MKFLILGCGSFAGQALYSDFIKKGYEVYGINRSKPKDSFFGNGEMKSLILIGNSSIYILIQKN